MPYDEIIPKEMWDPSKVNEVITLLKDVVPLPKRRKQIFAEWCGKVGIKMSKDQVAYLTDSPNM
jgi:hypothetical protein